MFKFVNASRESLNQNGKRVIQRACEDCRRRKKRCHHHRNNDGDHDQVASNKHPSPPASIPSEPSQSGPIDDNADQHGPSQNTNDMNESAIPPHHVNHNEGAEDFPPQSHIRRGSSKVASETPRSVASRFVGDMNPESAFLTANDPNEIKPSHAGGGVGVWMIQNSAAVLESTTNTNSHISAAASRPAKNMPSTGLFHGLASPLQQVFVPLLEKECLSTRPPPVQSAELFYIYVEKFQPILPVVDLEAYQALSRESPSRTLLLQGMCLVASTHPTSAAHLSLPINDHVVAVLTCEEFGERLFASMRILIEIGAIQDKLVIIQGLLLMWHHASSRKGGELSSFVVSRAVQYLYSLGLHIQQQHDELEGGFTSTLFCCVWAIDRLNATIQGRPVLIHERDVARPLQSCFDAQQPPFRLFLDVVALLDRTIALYRPSVMNKESTDDDDFILYEDLLARHEGSGLPVAQLVTIEILYHTVAILSCRNTHSHKHNETPSASAAARTRQALSVRRIPSILTHEHPDLISPFPFIPYSVSLCLSVAYRDLRRSKISVIRARARVSFEENCRILETLGAKYPENQAAAMAAMGRKMIQELERVHAEVTNVNRDGEVNQRDGEGQAGPQGFVQGDTLDHQETTTEPLSHAVNVPNGISNHTTTENDLLLSHPEMFNPDLFDMFTPSFDLDHIDSFLEGNLDLGLPTWVP